MSLRRLSVVPRAWQRASSPLYTSCLLPVDAEDDLRQGWSKRNGVSEGYQAQPCVGAERERNGVDSSEVCVVLCSRCGEINLERK